MSNLHVEPVFFACLTTCKWAIRAENTTKKISIWLTRNEAISAAINLVTGTSNKIVIHGSDGAIRSKDVLGTNPFPYDKSLFI